MRWLEEQSESQNLENYQSYKITQALKGKMTPSFESVIRLLKKGWNHHEKVQDKKE